MSYVSDGFLHSKAGSSFAPSIWSAYYVCPLTESVMNKYAVGSYVDLQHANSPNLGKYYLRILAI